MEVNILHKESNTDFKCFIDLPLYVIKKQIFFQSILLNSKTPQIKLPIDKNCLKFKPEFITLEIVDENGKLYYPDKPIKVYDFNGKIFELKDKFIVNNTIEINKKRIKIQDLEKNVSYTKKYYPDILIFLYDNNLDISKIKINVISIFDTVNRKEDFFERSVISEISLGQEHLLQSLDSYISLLRKEINTYSNFYYKILTDKFKDFKKSKEDKVLEENITITHNIISKGDLYNNFLNLNILFKKIQLSETIPFVIFDQKIKIFSDFNDKNLIKSWSIDPKNPKEILGTKGLILKVKEKSLNDYITVFILSNGKISIKFNEPVKIKDYYLFQSIKDVVKYINNLELSEFKLNTKDNNTFSYINYDIVYQSYLTKNDFNDILEDDFLNDFLGSDLFQELTTDNESIKLFTKGSINKNNGSPTLKLGSGIFFTENDVYRFNDLLITLRRSTSYTDSTLCIINGIDDLNKIKIVKNYLDYIFFLYTRKSITVKKKDNKNKKLKKELDGFFNPRDCQKQKQPIISDTKEPLKDSYSMNYKDKRIVCDNKEYPYPGFTTKNNVCCFKKDQRRNQKYIDNVEKQNIFLVQPSNLKYRDNNTNYPIVKKGNVYYYIFKNKLKELSKEKQESIEEKENELKNESFFFNEIPFYRLVSQPPSSICQNIIVNKDGELECPEKTFFSYNKQGYPCCNKNQGIKKIKLDKQKLVSLTHIINTDKILQQDQIGILPVYLKGIFNKDNIYRYGITQGNNSFLNAVSYLSKYSSIELQEKISKLIKKDTDFFMYLENGNLAHEFDYSKEKYISYVMSDNYKKYSYLWEILEYILDISIIIIDNIAKSIICHNKKLDDKNILIILKNKKTYEPIVSVKKEGKLEPIKLSDTKLKELYCFSCKFSVLPDFIKKEDISYQVLDPTQDNKIKYVVFKDGFIYPLKSGLGRVMGVIEKKNLEPSLDLETTLTKSKKYGLDIVSQIIFDNLTVCLVTDNNLLIPILKSEPSKKLQVSSKIYLDYSTLKQEEQDERIAFIQSKLQFNIKLHALKWTISQKLKKEKEKYYSLKPKEYIQDIVKDTLKTKNKNLKEYIIGHLIHSVETDKNLYFSGKISKEYSDYITNDDNIIITDIVKLKEFLEKE